MNITIKSLADEIGVSKQAVYKRATGKLKTVLAPYVHTEYNRMCFSEEGAEIIRNDFKENPCATPLFDTDMRQNAYVSNTERIRNASQNVSGVNASYTEHSAPSPTVVTNTQEQHDIIDNSDIAKHSVLDTEHIRSNSASFQSSYGAGTLQNTEHSKYNTNHIQDVSQSLQNAYGANTPCDRGHTASNTEHIQNNSRTLQSTYGVNASPDTERIRNAYGTYTDMQAKIDTLQQEITEKTEASHQQTLELVRVTSEKEKLEEIIKQLNQRISEKDAQIEEQRQTIQKTDAERRVLTASLFRNNEFIEKMLRLPLAKRIFGWKDVQKRLMDSQNEVADDVAGEGTVDLNSDENDNN